MSDDIVRVLRIIEYVGPRNAVEKQVSSSVHGTMYGPNGVTIRVTTLGEFPEIIEPAKVWHDASTDPPKIYRIVTVTTTSSLLCAYLNENKVWCDNNDNVLTERVFEWAYIPKGERQ